MSATPQPRPEAVSVSQIARKPGTVRHELMRRQWNRSICACHDVNNAPGADCINEAACFPVTKAVSLSAGRIARKLRREDANKIGRSSEGASPLSPARELASSSHTLPRQRSQEPPVGPLFPLLLVLLTHGGVVELDWPNCWAALCTRLLCCAGSVWRAPWITAGLLCPAAA